MPQPLADIGERLDLLKMTLGLFAPSEPLPIADEIATLAEEVFEHWLLSRGVAPPADAAGSARLAILYKVSSGIEPALDTLRTRCEEIARERDRVAAEPEHPDAAQHLLAAAAAASDIHAAITARLKGRV